MKARRAINRLAAVLLILGAAALLYIFLRPSRPPGIYVGVVYLMSHPSIEDGLAGFREGLQTLQDETGAQITAEYTNAFGEMANVTRAVRAYRDKEVDVVVALTTPCAQIAHQEIQDRPVIFVGVTDPIGAGLVDVLEVGKGNVVGTTSLVPHIRGNIVRFNMRGYVMSALPKERGLLTTEDAAAKEQLKQFRRRISQFGTSNGPTIDRYTASCRGWVKALTAASRAYYGRHVQDGALPQETFIRIAREIFEPRLQRFCGELLEILCDERFLSLVADRCDDITRAINQLEQAWASSSLISQQPQVFPAMEAVENALKRVELFRPILLKQSPPMSLISVAVAESRYDVSRKTLYRAVEAGRLIDHRQPGHTTNALLLLCENEVAQYWVKQARTNQ